MSAKAEAKIFGEWLTERMDRRTPKLTVPEVAREVGVDPRLVRGWRNGRGTPRGENMWRLFSALGYPVPAGLPRSTSAELAEINRKIDDLIGAVCDNGQEIARTNATLTASAAIRRLPNDRGEGHRELGQ